MAPRPTPQIVLLPEHPGPLPRKIKSWDQYGDLTGDTELFLLWLENKDVIYASLVADDDDAMRHTLEEMLPRRAQPISLNARQMIATEEAQADDIAAEEEDEEEGRDADLLLPLRDESATPPEEEEEEAAAAAPRADDDPPAEEDAVGGDDPDETMMIPPPPPSLKPSEQMVTPPSPESEGGPAPTPPPPPPASVLSSLTRMTPVPPPPPPEPSKRVLPVLRAPSVYSRPPPVSTASMPPPPPRAPRRPLPPTPPPSSSPLPPPSRSPPPPPRSATTPAVRRPPERSADVASAYGGGGAGSGSAASYYPASETNAAEDPVDAGDALERQKLLGDLDLLRMKFKKSVIPPDIEKQNTATVRLILERNFVQLKRHRAVKWMRLTLCGFLLVVELIFMRFTNLDMERFMDWHSANLMQYEEIMAEMSSIDSPINSSPPILQLAIVLLMNTIVFVASALIQKTCRVDILPIVCTMTGANHIRPAASAAATGAPPPVNPSIFSAFGKNFK